MASIAKRNQVIKMIGGPRISVKVTPWLDMMHVKCPVGLFLGYAAAPASEPITLARRSALPVPSWPASIFMPPEPAWAFLSVHIARFSLPMTIALNITKDVLFYSTWQAIDRLSTIIAMIFRAFNKLDMIFSADRMRLAIFMIARHRAKGQLELFVSSLCALSQLSTTRTESLNSSCARQISTLC